MAISAVISAVFDCCAPPAVIISPRPRLLLPRHKPFLSPAIPAHGSSHPRPRLCPEPLLILPMAMAKPVRLSLTVVPTHDRPCLQPNPSTPPARLSPRSRPSLPTAVRRLTAIQRDEETEKDSERQGRVLKKNNRQTIHLPFTPRELKIGGDRDHGHVYRTPVRQNQELVDTRVLERRRNKTKSH